MYIAHCASQLDYYAMNERWVLGDVKAVFSRRYLHQNKALEIFFANRCKQRLNVQNQWVLSVASRVKGNLEEGSKQ